MLMYVFFSLCVTSAIIRALFFKQLSDFASSDAAIHIEMNEIEQPIVECSSAEGLDVNTDIEAVTEPKDKDEATLILRAIGAEATMKLLDDGFQTPCACCTVDVYEVLRARRYVWRTGATRNERSDNLFALMLELSISTSSNMSTFTGEDSREMYYKIGKLKVCHAAFCAAVCINPTGRMARSILSKIKSGSVKNTSDIRTHSNSQRGDHAMAFLRRFAEENGDYPANDCTVVYVPYRNKIMLFRVYLKDMIGRDPVCESTFYNVWDRFCSDIKCMTESPGFKNCTTCTHLHQIADSRDISKEKDVKEVIDMLFDRHITQQRGERCYYDVMREEAMKGPGIVVIVVDAMDKGKTQIPKAACARTNNQTAEFQAIPKLGQVIIGVRAFYYLNGPEDNLFFVVLDDLIRKNTNSTIYAVHQAILAVLKKHTLCGLPTPPIIHLQMDNGPDNKSRWAFGYVADIVRRGIFLNATIAFMKAGHTHCNIDQVFSVVSGVFSYSQCKTVQEFDQILRGILPELKTVVIRVPYLPDMKKFYDKYLHKTITGHSAPHQFRYWMTSDGYGCQARMWFYCPWYPGRVLPFAKEVRETPIMRDILRRLSQTPSDASNPLSSSIIEHTSIDIPESHRVPNELTTKSLNWLKNLPDQQELPTIVPLEVPPDWNSTKIYLTKLFDEDSMILEKRHVEALLNYMNDRERDLVRSVTSLSDWTWPIVTRGVEEIRLADPYISSADIWQILYPTVIAKLSKSQQECVAHIISEFRDMQPDQVLAKSTAEKPPKPPVEITPTDRVLRKPKSSASRPMVEEKMDEVIDDDDDASDYEDDMKRPRKRGRPKRKINDDDDD